MQRDNLYSTSFSDTVQTGRQQTSYSYRAYGLTITSDRAMPMLAPCEGERADVSVTFVGDRPELKEDTSGTLVYPRPSSASSILNVWRTADGGFRLTARFRDEYCTFVVDPEGKEVLVAWAEKTPLQDVLLYLVGPVLGVVLRLRGNVCLHGSALACEGYSFVLIGSKGAGKSTMAAALIERGCSMLTDDVAVLTEAGGRFLVQPGYPGVRLRPQAAATLFQDEEELPALWSDADERHRVQRRFLNLQSNGARFCPDAQPVAAVYLLGSREPSCPAPRLQELPLMQGLLALAANTYVDYALTTAERAAEWKTLHRFVKSAPVKAFERPEGLDSLKAVCDVLLDDFTTASQAVADRP